jgi:hypothetical protein
MKPHIWLYRGMWRVRFTLQLEFSYRTFHGACAFARRWHGGHHEHVSD